MSVLKLKVGNEWVDVQSIKGPKGDQGDPIDVQVNGTSVVNNGVANVPVAGSSTLGVVYVNGAGLAVSSSGQITTNPASLANCKGGTAYSSPITPNHQHDAVFYGLAKAAGNSDQSSSDNAVGVYTADALVKIQKMLGIYEAPWELIAEGEVTNAEEANIDVAADTNGDSFELTDVRGILYIPTQNNAASFAGGAVQLISDSGVVCGMAVDTKSVTANSTLCGAYFMMEQKDGMMFHQTTGWHNSSVMGQVRMTVTNGKDSVYYPFKIKNKTFINRIRFPRATGTFGYAIFGKRKWTL